MRRPRFSGANSFSSGNVVNADTGRHASPVNTDSRAREDPEAWEDSTARLLWIERSPRVLGESDRLGSIAETSGSAEQFRAGPES